MGLFTDLNNEIESGLKGDNHGIPMGLNRLNNYIGIRKKIFTHIFGSTGSGKSAFVHSVYILNPIDYCITTKKAKMKVILFSMERSKIYILAKWMSRKIFLDQGIFIPIQVMLGWWKDKPLTHDQHDLISMFEDYFNELETYVDIIEGAQNPTGIYKYVKGYALSHGREEVIDEYHKIYIPDNPNEIVEVIGDHFGLLKKEGKMLTKKEAIDKTSEYYQFFRDFYGYSCISVSQVTRNMSNPVFTKVESFEPTLDDAKESGRPPEDCDVAISLFDPLRYRTTDQSYDVQKFLDNSTGANYFRKCKILKNTYGEDQIGIGMGFFGATGIFQELPKPGNMENFHYEDLFNQSFFLKE